MHRKYRSILDTSPELICRYSPDLVLTFVNRRFSEFFGYSSEGLIDTCLLDILKDIQRDELQSKLAMLSFESPTVSFSNVHTEARSTEKNRNEVHLKWVVIALYDDSGHLTGYQSIARDVTLEHQLALDLQARNTALEAMQSEMRILLNSLPCKVWYKDGENTILKLNAKAASSMGMDVESVEGKNTYDLFGDSAKAYHDDDLMVIKTGEPLIGRVERYTPNQGDTGWVQTDKIPFDHPVTGEKRILVVATDITKLKEQEALLQSINKNLDDFASLTSHDLQAPLRHIGIFAELLKDELQGEASNKTQEYLEKISDGVDNMHNLIKSFLKFMRASPQDVKLDDVNLTAVLKDVADHYSADLERLGGKITLPDEKIHIRGDKVLLNQVIGNLVENSIKYRHDDVPVQIDVSASKESGQWHVSVADNAIGIDKGFAPYVFDLFGRAKPHSNKEGSGVGLALCKRIITLHGGNISFMPRKERGSEFKLSLNASKQ